MFALTGIWVFIFYPARINHIGDVVEIMKHLENSKKKRVAIAMSGGVDSSTSAFLLKEAGFEVVGVTMCLGIKDMDSTKPRCCGAQAINDAKRICDKLRIPHHVMDFSTDFQEKVINKFVAGYLQGRTPNPCIECNRFIKFGVLLEKILSLGFDYLATGHYAKIEIKDGRYFLKRPRDKIKDQTYFLYPLKYEYLKHVLFPLGGFTKRRVKGIAEEANLAVAGKPQSQDICFIPDKDYCKFIEGRTKKATSGSVVDLSGRILGNHKGIFSYTVGQREGLGVSSKRPLYVISIDAEKNQLVVGDKKDLRASGLVAGNVNLLVEDFPESIFAKIRYTHKGAKCKITNFKDKLKVLFEHEQEAITPGQSVVFYHNNTVLGGGIIEEVLHGYKAFKEMYNDIKMID